MFILGNNLFMSLTYLSIYEKLQKQLKAHFPHPMQFPGKTYRAAHQTLNSILTGEPLNPDSLSTMAKECEFVLSDTSFITKVKNVQMFIEEALVRLVPGVNVYLDGLTPNAITGELANITTYFTLGLSYIPKLKMLFNTATHLKKGLFASDALFASYFTGLTAKSAYDSYKEGYQTQGTAFVFLALFSALGTRSSYQNLKTNTHLIQEKTITPKINEVKAQTFVSSLIETPPEKLNIKVADAKDKLPSKTTKINTQELDHEKIIYETLSKQRFKNQMIEKEGFQLTGAKLWPINVIISLATGKIYSDSKTLNDFVAFLTNSDFVNMLSFIALKDEATKILLKQYPDFSDIDFSLKLSKEISYEQRSSAIRLALQEKAKELGSMNYVFIDTKQKHKDLMDGIELAQKTLKEINPSAKFTIMDENELQKTINPTDKLKNGEKELSKELTDFLSDPFTNKEFMDSFQKMIGSDSRILFYKEIFLTVCKQINDTASKKKLFTALMNSHNNEIKLNFLHQLFTLNFQNKLTDKSFSNLVDQYFN